MLNAGVGELKDAPRRADQTREVHAHRSLTWLAAALSLSAILMGLAIAKNCDAPDWQQAVMLLGLPPTAALFAGVAVGRGLRRRFLAIVLGLSIGGASWFASLLLWVGSCSA